jgi:hypothetical protein
MARNVEEVRVYYECFEQARHYVAPIAQHALKWLKDITFIEISTMSNQSIVAKSLAGGLSIRNPDSIVTVVIDGTEHPLAWIEFTTQVFTEDHSLQGFNSLIAAGMSRIPFVKIVARRKSESDHGGNTSFDYREPYRVLWREHKTPGVQLDWPLESQGTRAVRDATHKACPPADLGLAEILSVGYEGILLGKDCADYLVEYALQASTPLAKEVAMNLTSVKEFSPNAKSTRFYIREDQKWELKFNRWGHSMDPERGMAEYYGNVIGKKLCGRINDKDARSTEEALENLRRATGISVSQPIENEQLDITYDITNCKLNRAGLIIAWYLDEFVIADQKGVDLVRLRWNVEKPTGLHVKFSTSRQTVIVRKEVVTEDDVTYVIANNVLPANGFEVQSVSYPGAQGDFGLLTGSGRAVKRKFFDVIGRKSHSKVTTVMLIEAKGARDPGPIEVDAEIACSWRDDEDYRINLLQRLSIERQAEVLACVAYPGEKPLSDELQSEVDCVVTVNENNWRIWVLNGAKLNALPVLSGVSDLPVRYKY